MQTVQEPLVNVRHLPNLVYRVAEVECSIDSEDTLVSGVLQLLVNILDKVVLDHMLNQKGGLNVCHSTHLGKAIEPIVNRADSLLECLLESPSNGHDLADRLHAAAEQGTDASKFFEIPTRNLHNAVVKRGLEAGRCDLRDRVLDFVQRDSKAELRGNESERVSCRLRGKGRRTGETSIDLRRG